MSRSGQADDRLSESYKQKFRDIEIRLGRAQQQTNNDKNTIFTLKNQIGEYQAALAQRDTQLQTVEADAERRLLALAQRFGFDSVGAAEAAPAGSYTTLVKELEATQAALRKQNDRLIVYHEDLADAMKCTKAEEARAARLEGEVGVLKEAETLWRGEVRRVEEVERLLKNQIAELQERLAAPPPAPVDKENRVLQPTHTSTNSAPSTPTKPRTPGRRRDLSLPPQKSPSKLPHAHLVGAHRALLASHNELQAAHTHLSAQHSALTGTHTAVRTAYAADRRKWHALKDWLYGDDAGHRSRKAALGSDAERRKYEQERLERKRKRFVEARRELKDKEGSVRDLATPEIVAAAGLRPDGSAMQEPAGVPDLNAIFDGAPTSSPSTITPTKRPAPFGDPTTEGRTVQTKRVRRFTQASSDTEEDSQAFPLMDPNSSIYMSPTRRSKKPMPAPVPVQEPAPAPTLPVRRATPPPPPNDLASTPTAPSEGPVKPEPSSPTLSPVRPRRAAAPAAYATPVSAARPAPVRVKEEFVQGSSVTPLAQRTKAPPVASSSRIHDAPPAVGTSTPLGRPNEPARKGDMAPPQASDYSVYKGRGRYGRPSAPASTTINAAYEIDPAQNDGRAFAFNDTVRGHAERKKLPAGDCDECREYYAAIGALPERLQRPAWRSLDPSPVAPRAPCSHHSQSALAAPDFEAGVHATEVAKHRADVSRHRAQWESGPDPPHFWDIGFPDTQEAAQINEEAEAMHGKKRRAVEADGRYRKR